MHTPGPWELIAEAVEDSRGNSIAMVVGGSGHQYIDDEDNAECLANARLIASAPMLLEALVAALHDLETSAGLMACDNEEGHSLFQLTHPSTRQVIAAIAAARGN